MRSLTITAFLIFCFAMLGLNTTLANHEVDECYYFTSFEESVYFGIYSFEDCATLLIFYAVELGGNEANGFWGSHRVYVSQNGEVFYLTARNEWQYWSTIDIPIRQTNTQPQETIPEETTPEDKAPLTLLEVMNLGERDIDTYWTQTFAKEGIVYRKPTAYLVEFGDVSTQCGAIGDSTGPAYCTRDNSIYLPLGFMDDQFNRIGDYAVVIIIAHEWAHSVEAQLRLLNGNLPTKVTELMADCLAGSYTKYLINESEIAIIEQGDVEEASIALFEAGDRHESDWFEPRAHGTGVERTASFENGMNFGAEVCFQIGQ